MADKMAKGLVHMQDFTGVRPEDRMAEPLRDRIGARVQVTASGCWQWQGALSPEGYGRISIGSRRDQTHRIGYAHRVSYETFVGPIPEELVLDHRVNVVVRGQG